MFWWLCKGRRGWQRWEKQPKLRGLGQWCQFLDLILCEKFHKHQQMFGLLWFFTRTGNYNLLSTVFLFTIIFVVMLNFLNIGFYVGGTRLFNTTHFLIDTLIVSFFCNVWKNWLKDIRQPSLWKLYLLTAFLTILIKIFQLFWCTTTVQSKQTMWVSVALVGNAHLKVCWKFRLLQLLISSNGSWCLYCLETCVLWNIHGSYCFLFRLGLTSGGTENMITIWFPILIFCKLNLLFSLTDFINCISKSLGVALVLCQSDPILNDGQGGGEQSKKDVLDGVRKRFIEKVVTAREDDDGSSSD